MINAVIVGNGMVGKATAHAFNIPNYFDRNEERRNVDFNTAATFKYIFICLPTPTVMGYCFTDDILKTIREMEKIKPTGDRVYIIRSTVYPGFADHVRKTLHIKNVISNPEFLSEDTWKEDSERPMLVIIGGEEEKYLRMIEGIYVSRYKNAETIITNNSTAEMIKWTLNAFFALKVAYANELFDVAQVVKANYEVVKQALTKHPWGSKNHWTVWYKEKRGIHGRCLPKDTEAFAEFADSPLLKSVLEVNRRFNG